MAKFCITLLLLVSSALGQVGPQFVQPSPRDGYPLAIETNWGGWEAPILVYEDSNLEMFTTKGAGLGISPLLTHRVFDEDGTYHTIIVSHYKNGYQCKGLFTPAEKAKIPNFNDLCESFGYKLRTVDVDTRARKYRVTRQLVLDTDGFGEPLSGTHSDWDSFDILTKDVRSRPLLAAINRITELIRKESRRDKIEGKY